MERDYYSRTFVKDGKLIREEIVAEIYDVIKISGNAIIKEVGGNGRFKFTLNGSLYSTEFEPNICMNDSLTPIDNIYYDYSDVNFNINILKEWFNLYINNIDKESYWKPI
ncbi:MAG: hypothetical protein M0R17_08040 [Candidatus Omnitrophica bacterium]|jgi:hypothetical protein|nr:hypothetical protein [Candidatus Omnitrophota bacterium]